jgi:hypothetical protein
MKSEVRMFRLPSESIRYLERGVATKKREKLVHSVSPMAA